MARILCWTSGTNSPLVLADDIPAHTDSFIGLMFHRPLSEQQGVWLDMGLTSRFGSAIHMLFVFFPIAVFWLDRRGAVVDKALARPFRLFYMAHRAARYVVELHPSRLPMAGVGDRLELTAGD